MKSHLVVLTLLAWGPAFAALQAGEASQPNIVLIIADDLGYNHLGCYGQEKIKTPRIDQMAAEGMKFTQAYAGSHVCAPSRSALMTGQHTGHTAIRANGSSMYYYDKDVTVAEVLKEAGYTTGGFGKWGGGIHITPGAPWRQGFDDYFGQLHQIHAHFYYPYYLWQNGRKYLLPGNRNGGREQYAHDIIHQKAKQFIRENSEGPFFAYLPYIIPHVQLVVPEESEKPYRDQFPKVSIPDPRKGYIGSDHAYATYAGMITRLDRHVGEILDLLEDQGVAENTLVLFTSDNGAQGGAWDPLLEFFNGNGALRGHKGQFYEGGIRVPLIAWWPGQVEAGSVTDHICAFWDFLPTFAELASTEPPEDIDGISLVPTLLGRGKQKKHDYLYWEYPRGKRLEQAVRMGNWKLVKKRSGQIELYNLDKDLGERNNIAEQHPEIVQKMKRILKEAHTPGRPYPQERPRPGVETYVK